MFSFSLKIKNGMRNYHKTGGIWSLNQKSWVCFVPIGKKTLGCLRVRTKIWRLMGRWYHERTSIRPHRLLHSRPAWEFRRKYTEDRQSYHFQSQIENTSGIGRNMAIFMKSFESMTKLPSDRIHANVWIKLHDFMNFILWGDDNINIFRTVRFRTFRTIEFTGYPVTGSRWLFWLGYVIWLIG